MRFPLLSSFKNFTPATLRFFSLLSLVFLALGFFIIITWQLKNGTWLRDWDEVFINYLVSLRRDSWNGPMVDITALGSVTIEVVLCTVSFIFLWLVKRETEALFLVVAVSGAGLLSRFLKLMVGRERPSVPHLVEVVNFSYPSGHALTTTALFLALALLASRHVQNTSSRVVLFVMAFILMGLVSFSRLYLGVHYLSDVLSGVFLGISWTLFLTLLFFKKRTL
ncbi:phosphatase PAP2 family protein [bacterium]|nr:phosphatase PAP2 family protein [bacterium]